MLHGVGLLGATWLHSHCLGREDRTPLINCDFGLSEEYKSWQMSPESYSTFYFSVVDVYFLVSAGENLF